MNLYHIAYDLTRPGQNYPGLIDAIQSLGEWRRTLLSGWFVISSYDAYQIRNYLQRFIDPTDRLVVIEIRGENAWQLHPDDAMWLKQVIDSTWVPTP